MKAKLEFDLPEDENNFRNAIDGHKWRFVVWQLDTHLRKELKYNEALPEDSRKALSETRDMLHKLIIQDNLELD